jgi:hypothetical protein
VANPEGVLSAIYQATGVVPSNAYCQTGPSAPVSNHNSKYRDEMPVETIMRITDEMRSMLKAYDYLD